MSIDKTLKKYYTFSCDFMFSQGHEMIKEICKDLGIKKLNLKYNSRDKVKFPLNRFAKQK